MNAFPNESRQPLFLAVEDLIAEHGGWRTMKAVVAKLLTRKPKRKPLPVLLSPHLMRDMGLHDYYSPPEPWELR